MNKKASMKNLFQPSKEYPSRLEATRVPAKLLDSPAAGLCFLFFFDLPVFSDKGTMNYFESRSEVDR